MPINNIFDILRRDIAENVFFLCCIILYVSFHNNKNILPFYYKRPVIEPTSSRLKKHY